MARLDPKPFPFPELGVGSEWKIQQEALDKLQAVSDNLPPGKIVGAVLAFGVADGSAIYIVTKEKPFTIAHVDYLDGYMIPYAHVRGLTAADVRSQLASSSRLRALFSKKGGSK